MSDAPAGPDTSRMGRFIQTYSSFLSSFVIGVAGLIATSVWQYRQSQITARQAESDQKIARTKADNEWRIARAEILAKNLNILAAQGPAATDAKFGVLLSLTRGNIIDPELAVSYALELGRENAAYMRTVLAGTAQKNYLQLSTAFALTCLQRFGVEKAAEICKDDKLAERSNAIAQLIQDELGAASQVAADPAAGPLSILHDQRDVHANPGKLAWLFEPYLQDLYERRQWADIQRFEDSSTGARLVAALVLATARTGELVGPGESAALDKFHTDRRRWLTSYLFGRTCDGDCRSRLLDVMLSMYGEAEGDFDEALKKIVLLPRNEGGQTTANLHARLLWCQIDADDLASFRDSVLVPSLAAVLASGKAKDQPTIVEDLLGLLALVPEPTEGPGLVAWKAAFDALAKAPDRFLRVFQSRRATAARERAAPPAMIKKVNFCAATARR